MLPSNQHASQQPIIVVTASKTPVLLYKQPKRSLSSDPYGTLLDTSSRYNPIHLPVLTEIFRTADLADIIRQGREAWDGVIISSKRGAEGWVRACADLTKNQRVDWSTTPLFTVGTSSRQVLSEADLPPSFRPGTSSDLTGNSASHLVTLILTAQPSDKSKRQKYLFIRGDKSLEELPKALRQAGREIHEVIVYETREDPDFTTNLHTVLNDYPITPESKIWMAFFSPSSASIVLEHLRRMPGGQQILEIGKVFAIGPTTARFLEEAGMRVDAIAREPNAEGMMEALSKADE